MALVWRTNAFISGSPKSLAQEPTKPPPKPLEPAIPTVVPFSFTTVLSPSRTVTPASSRTCLISSCRSLW